MRLSQEDETPSSRAEQAGITIGATGELTRGGGGIPGFDFQLKIQPGNASVADIRRLLKAINQLHVALGGLGFEFEILGSRRAPRVSPT